MIPSRLDSDADLQEAGRDRAPLFTVVMPVYNRAAYVSDAVNSVLAQTFEDFEFIIADDNSTDETRDVLHTIDDPRIRVVSNYRSPGAAGARNAGIFLSRGEWICQIDSDDLWPPDMLELLAGAVERVPETVGIVYGSLAYVDMDTGRVLRTRRAEASGDVHVKFLENHFIHHCAAALRASVLKDIGGYDETFRSKMDSDLLLRMTATCLVEPVPDLVYGYRVGGEDHLSIKNRGFLVSYEQYMKKHAALLAAHPRARFGLLSNLMVLSVAHRDWSRALQTGRRLAPALVAEPLVFFRAIVRLLYQALDLAKGRLRRLFGAS